MTAMQIHLAPGASGNASQLHPHRDRLAVRGFEVELLSLPKGSAERAVPVYRDAVPEATRGTVVIGGQSFGGRVASLIAAEVPPAALVLFCYPLHAPGRHEAWRDRTAHWPAISCPVLLLSGEADPFARIDLLRDAVKQLPDAELRTWPGVGHGLRPVLDEAMDLVAGFVRART
ncbi:MAG: dienelactone hydrolase family protein [Chloroflexota bacterium]|jgi:predicted alpha/beta-hydrolase family hydrolase|nr:dienelactone hydrolase family protein [Chloroflexota bacterium]